MSRSRSLHTSNGSWRAGGLLGIAFVLGTTLGLAPLAGASPPPGSPGASGSHPGLVYTSRVVGSPQHGLAPTHQGRTSSSSSSRPAITTQPVNDTVTAGSTASFTATASGSPTPTEQWQVSTNGGGRWSNISGASSSTYSFTAQTSQNGYKYRAVFSNRSGSATSNTATLTVTSVPTPPSVTGQPSNETVASGSTASFSASASGSPTPSVQWEVSTDGGKTFANASGATSTSTTYTFTAQTSQNGDEFEAVFTNTSGSTTTNTATLTVSAALDQSSNWSGYADMGSGFSAVNGNWTVPTVSCTSSTSYSAHWIGIDGASSSTVEQDGTEADCIGGVASYDAWFEMYGDTAVNSGNEVELSTTTYPVFPGDAMTASVSVVSNVWTLAISDNGSTAHPHTWSFNQNETFAAAQSSAEWVVERPELCSIFHCSLATLANFGSVTFTNATATDNATTGSISATSYAGIEMVNGSTPIAVPGSLDPTGTSFTDTYE